MDVGVGAASLFKGHWNWPAEQEVSTRLVSMTLLCSLAKIASSYDKSFRQQQMGIGQEGVGLEIVRKLLNKNLDCIFQTGLAVFAYHHVF